MELLPTMHVHSAIGLQLLALPSTLILCLTSMLRERSIGERDEKRLVRLYKQHAFILELVQLFVTLMAFGFATGNTVAAFEARALVVDYASEEVTRMIVKNALVRNAWLLGSAVCILACVNMLDSWSLPESIEDLTDPLFRLTRTLIGAYVRPRSTIDESQVFFCADDIFAEDLERSTHSKKPTLTHSLADLPAKKRTSESSDSDETITQPQVATKPGMDDTPRPTSRNPSKPVPTRALDSFPRLHAGTRNPSTIPPPSKKAQPHYQDQTMASSIRSLASSTSFSSFGSSTSFASLPSLASSTSNSSSTNSAKAPQQASQKSTTSRNRALSRNPSHKSLKSSSTPGKKLTSTTTSTSTPNKSNATRNITHRTAGRKRSVTFDLNPAVFPEPGGSEGDNLAALPDDDDEEKQKSDECVEDEANEHIQLGLVRVRVREIELGESASGETGLERQHHQEEGPVATNHEGRGGFGSEDGGDDENENCDEWEEEEESNGTFIQEEEEEALVRKQRPNVVRRDSGGSEV